MWLISFNVVSAVGFHAAEIEQVIEDISGCIKQHRYIVLVFSLHIPILLIYRGLVSALITVLDPVNADTIGVRMSMGVLGSGTPYV